GAPAAREAGRSLLTLHARAGDDGAEALFRALGWREAGRIPGYALDADRHTLRDGLILWRRLEA
ncbi:MAG: GNAT family N-acetyltransferase, partial [Acetobacteraceae bacterium]|nr:GNAT family N-acetyltransferase [Acetobacteraceae bacterium]